MPPPTRITDDEFHFHAYDFQGAQAWTESTAQPNRHGWTFYSMAADLEGLRGYGAGKRVPHIELRHLPAPTYEGRNVLDLTFGNNTTTPKPVVVITGGLHAREWIGHEIAYLVAEYLLLHYTTAPANDYERTISELVNKREIHILPMVNPDGNFRTVFGQDPNDRMWRKNRRPLATSATQWVNDLCPFGPNFPNPPFENVRVAGGGLLWWTDYDVPDYDAVKKIPPGNNANFRSRSLANGRVGVDLNRNNATLAWGYDGDLTDWNPGGNTYFGPWRITEAETGALDSDLALLRPNTAIDYHCYGQFILYPGEQFNRAAIDTQYKAFGQMLRLLVRAKDAYDYKLGSPKELVDYETTGTIADHIAQDFNARTFTIELDPSGDLGEAGFDLDQTKIRTVFEKNIRGALAALAAPAVHSTEPLIGPMIELLDWDVYDRGNRLPE